MQCDRIPQRSMHILSLYVNVFECFSAYRLWTETRMVPPSGRRFAGTGSPAYPLASPAIEGSEDGGDGRAASGRERGPSTTSSPPHAPPGKNAPEQSAVVSHGPAPRNQSYSCEGLGTGRSVDLQPDTHGLPGASMAVSSRSGAAVATTPRGGSATAPSSSEDVNPSLDAVIDILSTDSAPNEMLGCHRGRTSEITREPDGMFAA